MKRIISIVFSMLLLFSLLVTPSHAEGQASQPTKTVKLFMDDYGLAHIWLTHKAPGTYTDQTTTLMGTAQRYEHTFTIPSGTEKAENKFYLVLNLQFSGLYVIELSEETEKKMLDESKTSNGYIEISAIEKYGKRIGDPLFN